MGSREGADFDEDDQASREPMDENTQETIERNSIRSHSRSSNSSVNDPPGSLSRSTSMHRPVTANQTSWKSPNAFLNYVQDFRQNVRDANEVIANPMLLRIAGQQWRIMEKDQKQVYIDGAKAIKMEKLKDAPRKKFTRKRARSKSKVRHKVSHALSRGVKRKMTKRKNKTVKKPLKIDSDSDNSRNSGDSQKPVESDNESVHTDTSI